MLIWRVNVASQTLRREPAPETYERLGGAACWRRSWWMRSTPPAIRWARPTS